MRRRTIAQIHAEVKARIARRMALPMPKGTVYKAEIMVFKHKR